jgi:adenylosuccinate lyase
LHARGQPASLRVWGKKLVFLERLEEQMRLLFNIPLQLNGGATGNYNAHHVAYHKLTGEILEEICGRYFRITTPSYYKLNTTIISLPF